MIDEFIIAEYTIGKIDIPGEQYKAMFKVSKYPSDTSVDWDEIVHGEGKERR